jgi:phage gpG-like protein
MAVSVKIRVDDKEVIKMLKNFKDISFRKPLKQSGIVMERSIGMRFRKANWKGLSEATMKIHPRRKGGKPLNDTGRLKMSVTSRAVKHITKSKLEYGTNLIYAPLHNFGGRGGWGRIIPQREFLHFDDRDEKVIRRIFEEYIKELTK